MTASFWQITIVSSASVLQIHLLYNNVFWLRTYSIATILSHALPAGCVDIYPPEGEVSVLCT